MDGAEENYQYWINPAITRALLYIRAGKDQGLLSSWPVNV